MAGKERRGTRRQGGGPGPAGRERSELLQVEGRRPVLELLRGHHPVHRVLVAAGRRGPSVEEVWSLARERGVPVEMVDPDELARRAQTDSHQGVIALADPPRLLEPGDLLAVAARRGEPPLLLVCAEIQDPHNLGALFRTAEAAGAHGAVIPKHRSAPLSATVYKSSAGALVHLPVARVTNLSRAIEELKAAGVWTVAADPAGPRAYDQCDLTGPVAIVLGSEGRGVPRLVRERCDELVSIPMRGRVGSLNVSVAGGILLFEAARQRRLAGAGAR